VSCGKPLFANSCQRGNEISVHPAIFVNADSKICVTTQTDMNQTPMNNRTYDKQFKRDAVAGQGQETIIDGSMKRTVPRGERIRNVWHFALFRRFSKPGRDERE